VRKCLDIIGRCVCEKVCALCIEVDEVAPSARTSLRALQTLGNSILIFLHPTNPQIYIHQDRIIATFTVCSTCIFLTVPVPRRGVIVIASRAIARAIVCLEITQACSLSVAWSASVRVLSPFSNVISACAMRTLRQHVLVLLLATTRLKWEPVLFLAAG
jgi:hypothetical protein